MVYYNRQWGTVCDDHFGSDEADTACRSMGYAGAVRHSNTRSERSYTGNFSYWGVFILYGWKSKEFMPLPLSRWHYFIII